MNLKVILRYVGSGSYVAGVPANDLTESDVAASGLAIEFLLALHDGDKPLYVPVTNNEMNDVSVSDDADDNEVING